MKKSEKKKPQYLDNNLNPEVRAKDLLKRLTLKEKFLLCAGKDWIQTKPIKRLGIKSLRMNNGPHGVGVAPIYAILYFLTKNKFLPLRTYIIEFGNIISNFFPRFKKTTYFHTSICLSATWNPKLAKIFGKALAEEARSLGYHMIFAPGVNIVRTPLSGRVFEYLTEDPFLNKEIAVSIINGIQSQRVASCVKVFVANNQETRRFTVSSEVSERALHEIYFPVFEAVVKEADVWSVMASYNRVNGIHSTENKYLLVDKLMDEWGFKGFVVSDYFATLFTSSAGACIDGGLSLEMPGSGFIDKGIKYKVSRLKLEYNQGMFTEEALDRNIERLLRVMFLVGLFDDKNSVPKGCLGSTVHVNIARRIAEEGIVLLKNEKNLLPIDINEIKSIAVIGPNANKKMAFGGGSSMVRPLYERTPLEGFTEKIKDTDNDILIVSDPSSADIVIFVGGLNHEDYNDKEGTDRKGLNLPEEQINLIKDTVKKNPRTIVVLINGGPISMDGWIDKIPVIIEAWYPGMEGGNVIADIIFGDVNPSGKLPLTFPKKLSDSPAHASGSNRTYPGSDKVYYDEGIFVGYRYFDINGIEPLFPFGFGLSYTNFVYENLKIREKKISNEKHFLVSFDVTNSGNLPGAEIAQLYIEVIKSSVERPKRELKDFKKVFLKPKERVRIEFTLNKNILSFWDECEHSWVGEKRDFRVYIGASSRDIRLDEIVKLN